MEPVTNRNRSRIRRIEPKPLAKIVAVIYLIVSTIVCIPMGLMFTAISVIIPESKSVGPGSWVFFAMPFIQAFFAYLVAYGGAWIYNKLSSHLGGIELELENSVAL